MLPGEARHQASLSGFSYFNLWGMKMLSAVDRRALWRIALDLQRQYHLIAKALPVPGHKLGECWRQFQHIQRRHEWARRRGLAHAEAVCQDRLKVAAQQLQREVAACQEPWLTSSPASVTIRWLFDELVALSEEFAEVKWDLQQKTVSVRTDRIVLDEVDLGAFEIRLLIRELSGSPRYHVLALDPNPCGDDADTTHPHVHHNGLCEGDGHLAIQRALAEGRVVDFFVLVRQVLQTYNPSSAYRSLKDWWGTPCGDCGDYVSEDDRCECERCGTSLCGHCMSSCVECGQTTCSGCTTSCRSCFSQLCGSCQIACEKCGENYCAGCVEDGLCPTCQSSRTGES